MSNELDREADYSQGIMCGAGAVVLKDGEPLTVDDIVAELNRLQAAQGGDVGPMAFYSTRQTLEKNHTKLFWKESEAKIWALGQEIVPLYTRPAPTGDTVVEPFGTESAYQYAKNCGHGENMRISASLVIELVDALRASTPAPSTTGGVPEGLAKLRDAWRAYEAAVSSYNEKVEEARAWPLGEVSVSDEFGAMHEAKLTAIETLRNAADAVDAMDATPTTQPTATGAGEWGPKPTNPGYYLVRGYDDAMTEALVQVAMDDETDEMVCNLHDKNSDPVSRFSNLISEISDKFEWLQLSTLTTQQTGGEWVRCEKCKPWVPEHSPKTSRAELESLRFEFVNRLIYSGEWYEVCGYFAGTINSAIDRLLEAHQPPQDREGGE